MPSPTIAIGRSAPASSSAIRRIVSAGGATRVSGMLVGTTGSSHGASSTSIGSATKTGPVGGVAAILIARRRTRSVEAGSVIRVAHFVTGRAIATRSAAICASIES